MSQRIYDHFSQELSVLKSEGLFKSERSITSSQSGKIEGPSGTVINLCANNYLGLANHPQVIASAKEALDRWGYGMASVRFICGTQAQHFELEAEIANFLSTEDAILYSSCFDANTGLFETLLGPEDAIISDAFNHASIIDGIRLCKATRLRYANRDLGELETCLKQSVNHRFRMIVTDGVFSMDGYLADLPGICELADRYDALVVVDDSHAVGFMGATGRGTPELFGVSRRIDLITGTLGKALGGASGGFTTGRKVLIDWLRQRSRPYLFSNSLAPVIVAASLSVLRAIDQQAYLRKTLHENAAFFRKSMADLGFELQPGEHPIIPIMTHDALLAQKMSEMLLQRGVYVVGFSYPVVPKGQARLRTQMSAAHTRQDLELAIHAFAEVGRELGMIR